MKIEELEGYLKAILPAEIQVIHEYTVRPIIIDEEGDLFSGYVLCFYWTDKDKRMWEVRGGIPDALMEKFSGDMIAPMVKAVEYEYEQHKGGENAQTYTRLL